MRVLVINDLITYGGAEIQTFREAALLRAQGHVSKVLTFDLAEGQIESDSHVNIPIRKSVVFKAIQRLVPLPHVVLRIRRAIVAFSPDVIHLNNTWRMGKSLYAALEGYPVMQTIRDYGVICPKGTAIDDQLRACSGYELNDCRTRCGISLATRLHLDALKSVNRKRSTSVDHFVAPSRALASTLQSNGFDASPLPNPFDFSLLGKASPSDKIQGLYTYVGVMSRHKGVTVLLDAWRTFSSTHLDAKLQLAGPVDPSYADEFERLIAEVPNCRYLGHVSNQETMRIYRESHCVVVPSLWIENYPNSVLEAQASGTLVIGANRGGIPEMVRSDKWLFDVASETSILDTMESSYEVHSDEYALVTEEAARRVGIENSPALFIQKLMANFESIVH